MALDRDALLDSLVSHTCPSCGKGKRRAMTFCGGCFYDLPVYMRNALYSRIDRGYGEAVAAALGHLGQAEMKLPPAREGT